VKAQKALGKYYNLVPSLIPRLEVVVWRKWIAEFEEVISTG
jgi:hypothetical protein